VDLMTPIKGSLAATVPSTRARADMISMAGARQFNGAPGPSISNSTRRTRSRSGRSGRPSFPSRVITAPRRDQSVIRNDIEKLADMLVDSERPAILYGRRLGKQGLVARGHEEAIALLRGLAFQATSTEQPRICCPRAIRITSMDSRQRVRGSRCHRYRGHTHSDFFGWVNGRVSARSSSWCRSTWTIGTVGRT